MTVSAEMRTGTATVLRRPFKHYAVSDPSIVSSQSARRKYQPPRSCGACLRTLMNNSRQVFRGAQHSAPTLVPSVASCSSGDTLAHLHAVFVPLDMPDVPWPDRLH